MLATGKRGSGRTPLTRNGNNPPQSAADRFEVLERVGEGSLFVVYRVRDRDTGEILALKALKSAFAKHEEFALALAASSQRAIRLNHPYVERTLEVGEEEGTLFLVAEWLPGQSLESRLRRGPLGRAESASLLRQTTDALHYLHQNNIFHGDLRPRQILFGGGSLKLTDIGHTEAFNAAGITPVDVLFDSIYYQAPERFDGAPTSVATDLYSLGVTLYRMLSGRVPFDGPSAISVAARHRNDAPLRPSQFNSACPADLEEIALRLLAKDPQERYLSTADLLQDLGASSTSAPAAAPVPALGTATIAAGVDADAANDTVDDTPAAPPAPQRTRPTRHMATPDPDAGLDSAARELARVQRHRRRERTGALLAIFWTLVAAGLLVGIVWGAYYFWMREAPAPVRVPKFVGMHQADAEALLSQAGLRARVVKEVYDPRKPAGTVLSGDPRPGAEVRTGREITMTVSRGEEPTPMPDFTELSLDQARKIITRHGMRLGQVAEQYHQSVPKGYICDQYPQPGEPSFRRSEPVTLIVSRGPQPTNTQDDPSQAPSSLDPPPESATDPASTTPDDTGSGPPRVSRAIVVHVDIPVDSEASEVRVIVRDAEGEHVVYQQLHQPGDSIDERIVVVREQGTTAEVSVYVGKTLLSKKRV